MIYIAKQSWKDGRARAQKRDGCGAELTSGGGYNMADRFPTFSPLLFLSYNASRIIIAYHMYLCMSV